MTYSNARSCRWTQGGSKMCGICEFLAFYMSRKNEDMKTAFRLVMSLEPVPCLVTTCDINESHEIFRHGVTGYGPVICMDVI